MQNLPSIIYGTANVGKVRILKRITEDDDVLQGFLDYIKKNGINQIDTARRYGMGTTEEMLGSVKADQQGFLIDTKILPGTPGCLLRENLRESAKKSLEALQVKKVNILYLHAPDRSVPLEDALKSMNELYQEGVFEKLGISNYSAEEVEQVVEICQKNNYVKPSVYQGMYHIFARASEAGLFPILKRENISFYAYSPMAAGLFNYASKEEISPDSRYGSEGPVGQLYQGYFFKPVMMKALADLDDAAKKANLTKNEIAIRWIFYHSQIKRSDNDAVIMGFSKTEQLESNIADVKKGPLEPSLVQLLDKIWMDIKEEAPKIDHHAVSSQGNAIYSTTRVMEEKA